MKKKLEFDKDKYLKYSIWKLLSIIFVTLFLILICQLNKIKISSSDYKIIVMIILFIEVCYSLRLFLNYKYYRDTFQCKYADGTLTYKLVRYANVFENLLNFFDNMITIELNVDRIDRLEKKYGRIYVYGKMTLQKTTHKTKIKILQKCSFPDYCVGEEELKEFVTNKK